MADQGIINTTDSEDPIQTTKKYLILEIMSSSQNRKEAIFKNILHVNFQLTAMINLHETILT